MERRDFLKFALGVVAGTAALAATVRAAPLAPQMLGPYGPPPANQDAHPAVTSEAEVERLEPQEIRWGRRWHRRWHRRHWGWRRRHWGWRRRHWGWRRRWHRRYWRRRYW